MIPSAAFPQSSPQIIPGGGFPQSRPQMQMMMMNPPHNSCQQQSPGFWINTSAQVVTDNSQFNPQEEALYREKYRQLTKYIEPLKRMLCRINNVEKMTKMSKLLEILCNPTQRVPLDTLLKCEMALEKMDLFSYSAPNPNPLLEVINITLQSPLANHTLYRTFRPSLELIYGSDICAPVFVSREIEKKSVDQQVPYVLQGEIARLDPKFKIKLDSMIQSSYKKKRIGLICCLDDKHLPNVPPMSVCLPEEYPLQSPDCCLIGEEYSATPFLQTVQQAFVIRMSKLPRNHSLTHLLDAWEMAVRQACSQKLTNLRVMCELSAELGI